MSRAAALALVAYVVALASLATPLYEPLSDGRDDSWALAVLLAAAHLGMGMAVRRWWVLLLPVGAGLAAFALHGAGGLAWLILVLEVPALVLVTGLGWLLGRGLRRRAVPVAAAAFCVAAFPAVWAASATAQREPHVSAREQRALPTGAYTLIQDLCFTGDSRSDRAYGTAARRRARRQFDAIERSLRAHPDAVVGVRFDPADAPGTITREMTVRELAETHLDGAEGVGLPDRAQCHRRERTQLQRALDDAG